MKIEPLGSRSVVKAEAAPETSARGLALPKNATKEAPEKGTVVAVGPESALAVGDVVLFKKYAPDEIVVDGQKLLVLEEGDVIVRLV